MDAAVAPPVPKMMGLPDELAKVTGLQPPGAAKEGSKEDAGKRASYLEDLQACKRAKLDVPHEVIGDAVCNVALAAAAVNGVVSVADLNCKLDSVTDNLNHRLDSVTAKLDSVTADLNSKLDSVTADLNSKLDSITADLNSKLDNITAVMAAICGNTFTRRLNGASQIVTHRLQPLARELTSQAAAAGLRPAGQPPQAGQLPPADLFPKTRGDALDLTHAKLTSLAGFYGVDFGPVSIGTTERRQNFMFFIGA